LEARHRWLTSVILATQEVEIRRILVRSQARPNHISKNLSQKRAGEVVQGIGPEFKPQYCKKITNWNIYANFSTIQCPPPLRICAFL
jgi:hypothetical protein